MSNEGLLVISKDTNSTVSDDFKVSLLPYNPPMRLAFELWEACFHCREASWMLVPPCTIIFQFIHILIYHMLRWKCEHVSRGKVAAASTHNLLGTRCAISLLATINDETKCWVVQFHRRLDLCGSGNGIEDWGNIAGVGTTITVTLFPAASKFSNFLVVVLQTGDCNIHD